MKTIWPSLIFLITIMSFYAQAQPVRAVNLGDHNNIVLTGTGLGYSDKTDSGASDLGVLRRFAEKRARNDALVKLSKIVEGARVYGNGDTLWIDTHAILRNVTAGKYVFVPKDGTYPDGSLLCLKTFSISLKSVQANLRDEYDAERLRPSMFPSFERTMPAGRENSSAPFTSLVIYLDGKSCWPTWDCRIVSEDSLEVYSLFSRRVNRNALNRNGAVVFGTSLDQLKSTHPDRLGRNPLRVMATRVDGLNLTDPVISIRDAERVVRENVRGQFLDGCRVFVIFGGDL